MIYQIFLNQTMAQHLSTAIRSRSDVIITILNITKYFNLNLKIPTSQACGTISLCLSDRTRAVFCSPERNYSVSFPFRIDIIDGYFNFSTKDNISVNNQMISSLISLFRDSELLASDDVYSFLSLFDESSIPTDILWQVAMSLIQIEDGYIRLDCDPKNEKPDSHPLHHFDLFYSDSLEFKVGLRKKLTDKEFIDYVSNQRVGMIQ